MSRTIAFSLALFLFYACPAGASDEVLRVAVDAPYPPFAMYDADNRLSGFDVEIAGALCAELKRRCEIRAVPFDEILPAIAAGEIDMGVAGFIKTDERLKYADFTERYFRSLSIFMQWGERYVELPGELPDGLTVAVQSGTQQGRYLEETYPGRVRVIDAPSFLETIALLKEGRAQMALVDGLSGFAFLKSPDGAGYSVVGEPLSLGGNADWAAIAVSRRRPELTEELNRAITAIRRSGEYGRINRKYFDFNVY